MILRIEIPGDTAFRGGYVSAWHKAEGDAVGFGDDICDIAIDEFVALQRSKRAAVLSSTSRRQKRKVKDGYSDRVGRGVAHMRITSAEDGLTLGRILVPEGDRIEIGGLVGLLVRGGGDIDTAGIGSAPAARVAANLAEGEDDPWDEDDLG